MRISYDPEKNQRNIVERGLSFDEVANLDWNAAFILKDDRRDYGEDRYRVLGKLGEELYAVVFTPREDEIRVISFRRANRREEILYDQRQANERGRREPGVDRGGDAPG
jgi:uncharacterized DUF497 family protein